MSRTLVRTGERRDMSTKTLKQIAALGGLSAAELKDRWRDVIGAERARRYVEGSRCRRESHPDALMGA